MIIKNKQYKFIDAHVVVKWEWSVCPEREGHIYQRGGRSKDAEYLPQIPLLQDKNGNFHPYKSQADKYLKQSAGTWTKQSANHIDTWHAECLHLHTEEGAGGMKEGDFKYHYDFNSFSNKIGWWDGTAAEALAA